MGTTNLPEPDDRCNRMVRADEIRWAPEPDDRLEDVNLLALEDHELLEYFAELRADLRAVRMVPLGSPQRLAPAQRPVRSVEAADLQSRGRAAPGAR